MNRSYNTAFVSYKSECGNFTLGFRFSGWPSMRTKALSRHKIPVQWFSHRVVARVGRRTEALKLINFRRIVPLLLQIWSLVPSRGSSKKVEKCPTVRKCKTGTRPGLVV